LPEEKDITVMQIFKSSTPYWIIMLIAMVMIAIFPEIATYLPKLVF
jgi:TRAP-type mannitol/chloroaromatic compound transport system permease large subunit